MIKKILEQKMFTITDLIKFALVAGPLLFGGFKFYTEAKEFLVDFHKVKKDLRYVAKAFEDSDPEFQRKKKELLNKN